MKKGEITTHNILNTAGLTSVHVELLALNYHDGKSYRTIATQTGRTLASVRHHCERGRMLLEQAGLTIHRNTGRTRQIRLSGDEDFGKLMDRAAEREWEEQKRSER